ncbi:MAG: SerThr protein phosphatase family protein [Acidobacteria bacterium]|nr:SerThr protein phosphatase family protein [Acidobacteriota bacterium]
MRIHPTSDWHIDIRHNDWSPPPVDADVVVHLGDLRAPGTLAIPALRRAYPDIEHLLYVLGNHDFYSDHRHPDLKTTWEEQRARAPEIAARHDVTLLDDQAITIDGVRFVGATLWTDFMMRPPFATFPDAQRTARAMNDYRLIKTGRGRSGDMLATRDTINAHKASRAFIERILAMPFDGDTVVCTHHAPSRRSLSRPDSLSDLDWCYASNLESLMTGPDAPALWLHGHVHRSSDYAIGGTRVMANPRGYPEFFAKNAPRENPHFDPQLIVEVGYDCTPQMRM